MTSVHLQDQTDRVTSVETEKQNKRHIGTHKDTDKVEEQKEKEKEGRTGRNYRQSLL